MIKNHNIIVDEDGNLLPEEYEAVLSDYEIDDDDGIGNLSYMTAEEFLKEYNDEPEIYGDIVDAYCVAHDVPSESRLTYPSALIVKADNFDAEEVKIHNISPQSYLSCKILGDGYVIFYNCDGSDEREFLALCESTKENKMNKLDERVFTDRDFDNRVKTKAKPGEIWSAVQNLQDMFESAKKEGDRRMKENLVSFNNRRIDSFKETGLKNISDAELKAEYCRRFGESEESKKNKRSLNEMRSLAKWAEKTFNNMAEPYAHYDRSLECVIADASEFTDVADAEDYILDTFHTLHADVRIKYLPDESNSDKIVFSCMSR